MSKEIRIFDEQVARKPDRYPWANKLIQAMWDNPWNPSTFDFSSDIQDFKVRMSEEEKEIVVRTLSAIGQIEISVKKYWSRLGDNLDSRGMMVVALQPRLASQSVWALPRSLAATYGISSISFPQLT